MKKTYIFNQDKADEIRLEQRKANRMLKYKELGLFDVRHFLAKIEDIRESIKIDPSWIDIEKFYEVLYNQTDILGNPLDRDLQDEIIIEFIGTMQVELFKYYQAMYESNYAAMSEHFAIEAIATLMRQGKLKPKAKATLGIE